VAKLVEAAKNGTPSTHLIAHDEMKALKAWLKGKAHPCG